MFCTLKSKLVYLREEYTKLQQYYADIKNNDWDDIQCDIENMEMYFKYQKEDLNREIELKNIEQSVKIKSENDLQSLVPSSKNSKEESKTREVKDFNRYY